MGSQAADSGVQVGRERSVSRINNPPSDEKFASSPAIGPDRRSRLRSKAAALWGRAATVILPGNKNSAPVPRMPLTEATTRCCKPPHRRWAAEWRREGRRNCAASASGRTRNRRVPLSWGDCRQVLRAIVERDRQRRPIGADLFGNGPGATLHMALHVSGHLGR